MRGPSESEQESLYIWHVTTEGVPGRPFKYLDYDTYSDFVVVARTEDEARNSHPSGIGPHWDYYGHGGWIKPDDKHLLKVTCVGLCTDYSYKTGDVICASFHAG